MTTMNFKGKSSVLNHHLTAAFHRLLPDRKKSVLPKGAQPNINGSMIIHGDNLLALKALMPTHAGRISCIYIDPPYNTGNEGWRYNDNVKSPMMTDWLGKVVDRDDLTRHDKWCCMMYPRLSLLHELLAEDGVIFVSIDDNEQHRLRMLMDEIYGEDNFIGNIIVKSNPGGRDYGGIAITHDNVVVYSKSEENELNYINVGENHHRLSDEKGSFTPRELRNRNVRFNKENRPNLYYPIYVNPSNADENNLYEISLTKNRGWVEVYPLQSRGIDTVWRWQQSTVQEVINIDVMGSKKRDGNFQIIEKYRSTLKRERSILDDTIYRNEQGTLALKEIFAGANSFDYPKSDKLIKRLIELGCGDNGVVLDSFAGSGTTAQAVLELNKEDGGNRKFVLVECEEYADQVTAERVRRVIKGIKTAKDANLKAGLGGEFSYWQLGEPLELQNILQGNTLPTRNELAAYLYQTVTGETWNPKKQSRKTNLIGATAQHEIYLFYEPSVEYLKSTALTSETVKQLPKPGDKWRLVFAPVQHIRQEEMGRNRIKFCQLPYEIYRTAKKQE